MNQVFLLDVVKNAIWECTHDFRTQLIVGVPSVTGGVSLLLGMSVQLSTITLILGLLTGLLAVIEKGIKIYKSIRDFKKEDSEDKD